MMRCLIIGVNYLPESTAIGPYTAGVAEYLNSRGHDVRVVTGFPMAPQWRIWDGYGGEYWRQETINGVNVLRVYLHIPRNPRSTIGRVLFDLSFCISSMFGALTRGPTDLVFAVSPPLQTGITAWIVSVIRRAPLFFHIQDLVPDAAVATGMLGERSLATRLARRLERFVYRRAEGIGVISEEFRINLEKQGVPSSKIRLLPNCVSLRAMPYLPRDTSFRSAHGIADTDFLVMYSGTIALKQGLDVLVHAAARARKCPRLKFMIIGEGASLNDLQQAAAALNVANLVFLPMQPRDQLARQLSAADVLVVTQRRAVKDMVFPGKLLFYMAAGRPIVAAVDEESATGRFVLGQKVGYVSPPEDPNALAELLQRVSETNEEAASIGAHARRTVEAQFDCRQVLPSFEACLSAIAHPAP
jgi:colanic acid biosynthesis glycosyl transferase WcaI